ncbi:MAG: helix-turn-helix domain-containing protein [Ruminococcaceae bacterium]|nr:helix-turn-helix domain-containing protein [Oscillospiraceae bacterium]
MEYTTRTEILPTYFQIGYFSLNNGLSIGERAVLPVQPLSALHYHHCLELGICLSGTGEAHIENRIYKFQEGDIQCVNANIPHMSIADTGAPCNWIWLFVDIQKLLLNNRGKITDELLKISDMGFNGVFSPYEHPELARLINALTEISRDDGYSVLYNTLLVGQILIESARIGDIDKNSKKLPVSAKIKPALLYIRENYADSQLMTAEKIAASCNLSTSHFRSLFKTDIGMTLPQYINLTRLSAAVHLLQSTDKTISNIATDVGYNEVPYFTKAFKDEFGISPKEMRKSKNSG